MRGSLREEAMSERIVFLRGVPLFAELREADLKTLVHDLRLRKYGKDEIIFHQGDESREMYIVVEGKIRIFKISPSGGETSLTIFSKGDIMGEFAPIDSQPRSATAKAIVPTTLLQIMRDRFACYMREMPDLTLAMNKVLVAKIRWTAAYAETIAQYDAAGRLLHILLLYNEKLGEEIEPGKRYILDLGLNQTDLASLVGARREWVNRLLRDWRKRNLIEFKAGQITILDLPAVEAERDSRTEANASG
jgi:CRP/FNR family cyclic AMP-dependent transcriptional regulator